MQAGDAWTIQLSPHFSRLNDASQQDILSSQQQERLTSNFESAKELLTQRKVPIDRLGKARKIVELLLRTGGAVAEVCLNLSVLSWCVTDCFSSIRSQKLV